MFYNSTTNIYKVLDVNKELVPASIIQAHTLTTELKKDVLLE